METRPTVSRRRSGILRRFGWLAAVALMAVSVFAPTASATGGSAGGCTAMWGWNAGTDNPWPWLSVTVWFTGDVPADCSLAFSMASYNTDGPTWPTSGTQSFLDFATGTIDAQHPSLTLTVAEPPCFGQTDFYSGSTRYDGVDGALPHYPDSPTPYGKIAGSGGGHECDTSTPSSPPSEVPSAPPSEAPSAPPSEAPTQSDAPPPSGSIQPAGPPGPAASPSGEVQGVQGTPGVTPPPTDSFRVASTPAGDGWRIVLGGLGALILVALFVTPKRAARRS